MLALTLCLSSLCRNRFDESSISTLAEVATPQPTVPVAMCGCKREATAVAISSTTAVLLAETQTDIFESQYIRIGSTTNHWNASLETVSRKDTHVV